MVETQTGSQKALQCFYGTKVVPLNMDKERKVPIDLTEIYTLLWTDLAISHS